MTRSAKDSGAAGAVKTQTGFVTEMFCSVQGEGLRAGERQLFVRTAGCSATCYWCDTVSSKRERKVCLVHGRERRSLPNPISVDEAVNNALELARECGPVSTVSITGGEPLEQSVFVRGVARGLREAGMRIHLETSGLEPEGLLDVREYCDVFAVDIKLPYATGREHWATHRRFLEELAGRDVFVKVVVDAITPEGEIVEAIELVAAIDRRIPFVVQPESSTYLKNRRGSGGRAALERLLEFAQRRGLTHLTDVRVIPQLHKVMKVR